VDACLVSVSAGVVLSAATPDEVAAASAGAGCEGIALKAVCVEDGGFVVGGLEELNVLIMANLHVWKVYCVG